MSTALWFGSDKISRGLCMDTVGMQYGLKRYLWASRMRKEVRHVDVCILHCLYVLNIEMAGRK